MLKQSFWEKKGIIFRADGRYKWMVCYAQIPTVVRFGERFRIYYATRARPDDQNQFVSYTSFVDVNSANPAEVVYIHDRPVLELGWPGAFDEFGIHPTGLCVKGDHIYLYYTGWSRPEGFPYATSIGLAVSTDGGRTYQRHSAQPILKTIPEEPYLLNGAFVIRVDGMWRMWYVAGTGWVSTGEKLDPVYVIKHAVSRDGVLWDRDGKPCLPEMYAHECTHRPCVHYIDDIWHMWFCHRPGVDFRKPGKGYRLGYAWSLDGINWKREDAKAGLDVSKTGWDSEMIAYPYVVEAGGKYYMFYNGNCFGRDGFGYAELTG